MSLFLFVVVAPLIADIEDAISRRVEAVIGARKYGHRARQYKFN